MAMDTAQVDEMLRTIDAESRLTQGFTGRAALRPEVMEAMGRVPREEFVPEHLKPMAYENHPLPIGKGQTISQPFIVALMTDLLNPDPDDVILEVGAGSGYQAAVLSLLVKQVYTLEIIPSLADITSARLRKLSYHNIEIRQGDGHRGWPEHAPFDGIIVTATAPHVPPALKEQLKPGGRIVIPVGYTDLPQKLLVLKKDENGKFTTRNILPVSFVPLTGEE